jgi:hypothetical protein
MCKRSASGLENFRVFSVTMGNMSSKRYQFKLIEADAAELETRLREAGSQQWSAVGYGVLPDGRRSVLMERKTKIHHRGRHRDHEHDGSRDSSERAQTTTLRDGKSET